MMQATAILDDYVGNALELTDWSAVETRAPVTRFGLHLSQEEAAARLCDFSILVISRERMALTRSLIERLPNLRFVVFSGTLSATIDFEALAARGIVVSRTVPPPPAGANLFPAAPAEMAFGLILAAARHIPGEEAALRQGRWNTRNGRTLRGRTLGIVGLGKIGRAVAGYATAFGMKVVAWSQNLSLQSASAASVISVTKEELFSSSDFVTLHYKLSPRSAGLVGREELGRMKSSAWLINTSRGELIDEDALLRTLGERRIGGAALDVFWEEPIPRDHPLLSMSNVILTPHLGYATEDFMRASYKKSAEAIIAFLDGAPINVVTPALLALEQAQS